MFISRERIQLYLYSVHMVIVVVCCFEILSKPLVTRLKKLWLISHDLYQKIKDFSLVNSNFHRTFSSAL